MQKPISIKQYQIQINLKKRKKREENTGRNDESVNDNPFGDLEGEMPGMVHGGKDVVDCQIDLVKVLGTESRQ